MAADILMYDSDVVPVGKDQVQHIEMARAMAQRFNHTFGDTLKLPLPFVREDVQTILGTDGRKMSKSYGNTIPVFLPPKKLRKKLMAVQTDSKGLDEPKDPDTCNVFTLYKLFASETQVDEMRANYLGGGFGYGHAKQALFDVMDEHLTPPRERYLVLRADEDHLEEVLRDGARRAREVGGEVLERVRGAVGLGGRK
jgi:tryptophanyl-tRNA synthetase